MSEDQSTTSTGQIGGAGAGWRGVRALLRARQHQERGNLVRVTLWSLAGVAWLWVARRKGPADPLAKFVAARESEAPGSGVQWLERETGISLAPSFEDAAA